MVNLNALAKNVQILVVDDKTVITSGLVTLTTKMELGTTFLNEDLSKIVGILTTIYLKNGGDKTKEVISELDGIKLG